MENEEPTKQHQAQRTILSIRQDLLVELGLTIIDAAILRYVRKFADNCQTMQTVEIEGELYRWYDYGSIIDELPILGIKEPRQIGRHFAKYVELGLMKKHEKKEYKKTRCFFYLTPAFDELTRASTHTCAERPVSIDTCVKRSVSSDHTGAESSVSNMDNNDESVDVDTCVSAHTCAGIRHTCAKRSITLDLATPELQAQGKDKEYQDQDVDARVGAPTIQESTGSKVEALEPEVQPIRPVDVPEDPVDVMAALSGPPPESTLGLEGARKEPPRPIDNPDRILEQLLPEANRPEALDEIFEEAFTVEVEDIKGQEVPARTLRDELRGLAEGLYLKSTDHGFEVHELGPGSTPWPDDLVKIGRALDLRVDLVNPPHVHEDLRGGYVARGEDF